MRKFRQPGREGPLDDAYDPLRSDPRFHALARKVGNAVSPISERDGSPRGAAALVVLAQRWRSEPDVSEETSAVEGPGNPYLDVVTS